ncbi:MAG TPA: hypothetical protein ENN67_08220 [Firmicutes bacterium]|nr:hypothetical protein [Bacillota bacterium]
MTTPQILLLIGGLLLVFFGLIFYKSFVKLVGFVIGGAYGLYLFTFFINQLNWEPLMIVLAAVGVVLILGIFGTIIASFASALLFFLAGGMTGLLIGKLLTGVPAETMLESNSLESLMSVLTPKAMDLIWFIGGGIVFVIALDWLAMVLFTVLGAIMIRFALAPMELIKPDWIIPGIIGLFGLMFQESMRRRAREHYHPLIRSKPIIKGRQIKR